MAIKRWALLVFIILGCVKVAYAATYYILPTGNDAGQGTADQPWATFRHAIKYGMQGGDTLILKDGTYTQSIGEEYSNQPYNNYSPPSGSVSAYTIIKAENDGQAVIEDAYIWIGGVVSGGVPTGSSYIQIEGLKLRRSYISIGRSHHIKTNSLYREEDKRIKGRGHLSVPYPVDYLCKGEM